MHTESETLTHRVEVEGYETAEHHHGPHQSRDSVEEWPLIQVPIVEEGWLPEVVAIRIHIHREVNDQGGWKLLL